MLEQSPSDSPQPSPTNVLTSHTGETAFSHPRLSSFWPRFSDIRELARLAVPIALIQLGMILMGVVDIIVVGHLSSEALAAVALGNLFTFGLTLFGIGVLLALDPLVSQALGARDEAAVRLALQRGLLLSVALTLFVSLLLQTAGPFMRLLRQPPELLPDTIVYVQTLTPAVWPILVFVVLRQTLQAHRQTFQLIVCVAAANVLNLALNVCLVFGHLGLPALGVAGSATATLISRWFMAIAMLCLGWQQLKPYLSRRAPGLFNVRPLYRMTALGLPIGMQMLLEWGAFSTINLLMGWIGVAQIGAHQVAANLVSLTHTVAWAFGAATTVLVGHAIGRGDPNAARRALGAGLTGILLFMCAATAAFVGTPQSLVGIYTNEMDVLRVAAFLLPIAAVFQLADGLQIGSAAFLRGVGDTRMPMVANLAGLWLLGVPAGAWLAFGAGLGAPGLWLGLVVGLLAVATFMLCRVAHVSRGKIERLRIDA